MPSGLHYRMNLETGRKEAKLMDVDVETGFILLLIRASSCIYLAKTIWLKTKTSKFFIDIKDSSSVIATNDNQSAEDEVNPIDNETVQKVKKQMEKMKMNRDLEHIQVIY